MRNELREALVAFINEPFKAAFPQAPLVFPNQPFDFNNPPSLYVEVELDFQGGRQIGASGSPKTRRFGDVHVTVMCKAGTGTASAHDILDWFESLLGYAKVGRAQFEAPDPQGPGDSPGWHSEQTSFPFWADEP